MIVAHDISHGLNANQQVRADGLRRRDTIRLWLGFDMRPGAGWGWVVASGVITLLAGLVFAIGWPANSAWLIGMMLAVELIIEGWGFIMLGLAIRGIRAS